jgi:hypothetical protein
MLNWYSCKSWVHWASALEVFTFYILKAPVRRTKKASVSVYGLTYHSTKYVAKQTLLLLHPHIMMVLDCYAINHVSHV